LISSSTNCFQRIIPAFPLTYTAPPPLPMTWLQPIPGLRLRHSDHTYWLGDHLFPISTTGVLSHGKSAFAMERINSTKDEWAPRGTSIHKSLELHLWGNHHPDGDQGAAAAAIAAPEFDPYREWIDPLLSHPLWDEVTVIATEMALCSRRLNIAGTFDGAFLVNATGQRTLFDLKSQKRADAGPYCTKAQLGCYMAMAAEQGISFDRGLTVWSRPGKARLQAHGAKECLKAWEAAWEAYSAEHLPY
jgi:hypothetical protein